MAQRLLDAGPPAGWVRRPARDRAASFGQPADGDIPARWLGGTCVPRAAAEAIVEGLGLPAAGTFCLCGGGAGYEHRLLLARLGPARCLAAVCEEDSQAALWLRLHDWAAAIRDGRLALFAGQDRWRQMEWFFTEHAGFEAPTSVACWPTTGEAVRSDAQRRCRTIHEIAGERRAERLDDLAAGMKSRAAAADRRTGLAALASGPPSGSSVLLAAGGGSRQARRWSRLIEGALRAEGADVAVVQMDSPATASGVPLAEAVVGSDPVAAILVDRLRGEIGLLARMGAAGASPSLPAISWLVSPGAADIEPRTILERLGAADVLVSCHANLVMACRGGVEEADAETRRRGDAGMGQSPRPRVSASPRQPALPAERAIYCPPAAEPDLLDVDLDAPRQGVAIVGDVTLPEPLAHGVTLPSLKALWESLAAEVAARWIPYSDEQFPTFLDRAQRRMGVQLERDGATPQKLRMMLRRIVADNQLLLGAAADLAKRGVPLRLFGSGWEKVELLKPFWAGFADEAGCREAVTTSAALLHLSSRTNATDIVADAAAAGCAILIKPLPSDPSSHGVSALLQIGSQCQTIHDVPSLLRQIDRLLKDPAARRTQAAAAREAIRRGGLMSHRLAALRQALVAGF